MQPGATPSTPPGDVIGPPSADGPEDLRPPPLGERWPLLVGALVGIVMRLVFSGDGGSALSAMAGGFIYPVPILVGMVTVYLAERQRRRSWRYYAFAPMLAVSWMVLGTLLILIEGLICAIIIIPLFAVLSAAGGLVMGALCRLGRWPKATLRCVSALPFLIAGLGDRIPTPADHGTLERSIVIHAPPSAVWQQIFDIDGITREEMGSAWAVRIGVPPPISGRLRETAEGRVRTTTWGKQVHFDEVIRDWEPERHVRWSYRFSGDSFPPGALDDHVVIGGHYFDLVDTSFTLEPEGGSTRLTTRVRYRVSTQFNFYADGVARFLLGDLSEAGLRLYKARTEAAIAAAR